MGRLGCDPRINHFSHPHPLELTSLEQSPTRPATCAGCTFRASAGIWAYSCRPCNYVLHIACAQMPQRIRHPAHPDHSLTLLPVPAYKEGSFNCDACGRDGAGFSYHCDPCGVDFHGLCASMPLSVTHAAHAHPLALVFFVPYENGGFSCDVCGGAGSNHWLYRCDVCEFDAHIGCATAKAASQAQARAIPTQQQPQPRPRPPAPMQRPSLLLQQQAQVRSPLMGMGIGVNNRAWQGRPVVGLPLLGMNGVGRGRGGGGSLMNQVIHEVVHGAAQQVGQSLVQNIFGGGGGGGGGSAQLLGQSLVQNILGGGGGGSGDGSGGGDGGLTMDVGSAVVNLIAGSNN